MRRAQWPNDDLPPPQASHVSAPESPPVPTRQPFPARHPRHSHRVRAWAHREVRTTPSPPPRTPLPRRDLPAPRNVCKRQPVCTTARSDTRKGTVALLDPAAQFHDSRGTHALALEAKRFARQGCTPEYGGMLTIDRLRVQSRFEARATEPGETEPLAAGRGGETPNRAPPVGPGATRAGGTRRAHRPRRLDGDTRSKRHR